MPARLFSVFLTYPKRVAFGSTFPYRRRSWLSTVSVRMCNSSERYSAISSFIGHEHAPPVPRRSMQARPTRITECTPPGNGATLPKYSSHGFVNYLLSCRGQPPITKNNINDPMCLLQETNFQSFLVSLFMAGEKCFLANQWSQSLKSIGRSF